MGDLGSRGTNMGMECEKILKRIQRILDPEDIGETFVVDHFTTTFVKVL